MKPDTITTDLATQKTIEESERCQRSDPRFRSVQSLTRAFRRINGLVFLKGQLLNVYSIGHTLSLAESGQPTHSLPKQQSKAPVLILQPLFCPPRRGQVSNLNAFSLLALGFVIQVARFDPAPAWPP